LPRVEREFGVELPWVRPTWLRADSNRHYNVTKMVDAQLDSELTFE
jgi:hypothetical protein